MKYTFSDLKNKVVLITGGSGLIGKQFVKSFINVGSKVIILDIVKPKKKNKNLLYINCDITNEEDINNALILIKRKYKKINILINNATNNYSPSKNNNSKLFDLENFSNEIWDKDLNVGLKGAFLCTKLFGKFMANNKGGRIINISSDLGLIGPDQRLYSKNFKKPVTYSVIKHGLIGLTKYTATYWSNKKILCNAIAPGGVYNNQPINFLKKIKKLIPLGRMAKKDEYNFLILFLASKHSSYLNGTTVIADGGRSII
tara:strand:- start:398 stop:1171 length:774 start_codon:yes stop_codon:yes gene_type:complete